MIKASAGLLLPALRRNGVRVMGMQKLLFLPAKPHPIDRAQQFVRTACVAGNQPASQQMLSHFQPAMRTGFPYNPIFKNK
jgi:hypothetical protein